MKVGVVGSVYTTWNETLNSKFPAVLQYRHGWEALGFNVHVTNDDQVRSDIIRLNQDRIDSDFLDVFDRLETPVMKYDFWRYTKLFLDGGIYADVDIEPHPSMTRWMNTAVEQQKVVLFEETPEYARNCALCKIMGYWFFNFQQYPSFANCIMIAPGPNASFFLDLLRDVDPEKWSKERDPRKTLMTTGPGLLTDFCASRDDVMFVGRNEGVLAYTHHGFGTWKPFTTYVYEKSQIYLVQYATLTLFAMIFYRWIKKSPTTKAKSAVFIDEECEPSSKGTEHIVYRKRATKH
jgi:Glycosyltransferase sugar-binding region containing DXD motif